MARRFPDCPERPEGYEAGEVSGKSFDIKVVTPIFGGGVEPGVVDHPSDVIRGSSVRGHLRFWWRATKGAEFENAAALLSREGEIWGTTKISSRVRIFIDVTNPGALPERNPKYKTPPADESPKYVVFPFNADDIANARRDAQFTLTLEYPPQFQEDVLAAVWAWVNFGGIGSRTRRGCGSLYCRELAPKINDDIHKWYKERLEEYKISPGHNCCLWPCLPMPTRVYIRRFKEKPMQAWQTVIQSLKKFRRGTGRKMNKPLWPKEKNIKEILAGATIQENSAQRRFSKTQDKLFRAELGLPIIFQFEKGNSEFKQATLLPNITYAGSKQQRMASPVILKPLALSEQEAVPIILRLNVSSATNLILQIEKLNQDVEYVDIDRNDQSQSLALDAFLAFVREEGYHGG